ncbi:tol-pal system-associated acyl-CoA thioesterase [Alteromonadaceae bacterium BrNp21-10]|nr:tol-pal system-associated acyl-CoA thioesterase [Alteromonadaceae bacterium BrNp21-10]
MSSIHHFPVRVYYEDTDAGGVVYYANYLKFLERARTEWLRELKIEQDALLKQAVGFVVRHVEMDNLRPAKFNELITVSSKILSLKKASLVFVQEIKNHKEQLLVSATIKVACVNLQKMRAIAIPPFILEEISRVC